LWKGCEENSKENHRQYIFPHFQLPPFSAFIFGGKPYQFAFLFTFNPLPMKLMYVKGARMNSNPCAGKMGEEIQVSS